jgi:hypothetical protein
LPRRQAWAATATRVTARTAKNRVTASKVMGVIGWVERSGR